MAASIGALRGKVYIVLEGKTLEDAIEVGEVEVPISVSFTPQKPGPTYRGHVGPGSDGGALATVTIESVGEPVGQAASIAETVKRRRLAEDSRL